MDTLIAQLKQLRTARQVNPDASWVARTRAELVAHMRKERVEQPARLSASSHLTRRLWDGIHIFLPERLTGVVRPIMTSFFVSMTAVGGWIATVSASYSVPGDVLYNVKLAAEKTQVAVATVAGSKEWQAHLHLRFATERAREAKEVVAKGEPEAAAQVNTAFQSLKKSIVAASDSIKEVSNEQPEKAVALAKDANEKTGEIVTTLNQVSKDATAAHDVSLTKEAAATTKVVNDASITVVEAVVQSQTASSTTIPTQEVKNLVTQKIDIVLADSKTLTDATSTVAMKVTSSSISTASSTAAVQGVIQEAKNLVQNNQLMEALQKVKEAALATQEVKQGVADAQQAVSTLAPITQATSTVSVFSVASTTTVSATGTVPTSATTTQAVKPK